MSGAPNATAHCRRALAVLALLVAALLLLGGMAWQAKRAEYAAAIADNATRVARFRAELARRPELEAALRSDRALNDVRRLYLAGDTPALAGADLQAQLRARIEAAGGKLVSSQIVDPAKAEGQERRLVVKVRMSGNAAVMLAVLHGLEGGEPALFIDSLTVNAARVAGSDELVIQFDVSGFLLPEQVSA